MNTHLDPKGVLIIETASALDEFAMREWVNLNLRFHTHPDANAIPHWNFAALKFVRAPASNQPTP